jgi:hypothetical protein
MGDKEAAQAEADGSEVTLEDVTAGDDLDISRDLFRRLRGGRHIVFANRRADVELHTDLLRRLCDRERVPNEFWPHHGSLSRDLREEAEDALRGSEKPATVLATTTLELGIDVGSVESIAQIGPPSSVASMRQRLGRSGRRGSPAVLRIYVQEPELDSSTPPHEELRSNLVQSIAMVRLLAERWYEPPSTGALHLSTLVQQVLSAIAQHGGVRANGVWSSLCQTGPFRGVEPPTFAQFLRDLAAHKLITQTQDGELVLDLAGERLVNHYDFYSAFTSPEEFRLVSGSKTLGTLPVTYPLTEGMHVIFGGRRWRVISVDAEKKVVELAPAGGGRAPKFGGTGALVHDRVRQEMRAVYLAADFPAFLDATALELLKEARDAFHKFGLKDRPIVPFGKDSLVFLWAGDRILNTIHLQLLARGVTVYKEGVALLLSSAGVSEARDHLLAIASAAPVSAIKLAADVRNKATEKHHLFLSDPLLAADYASSHLDTIDAHELLTRTSEALRRISGPSAAAGGGTQPKRDLDNHGQPQVTSFNRLHRSERSTSELIGMARAIMHDRVVTPDEVSLLISWFEANPEAALCYPGNILAKRLQRILSEAAIDPLELEDLAQILASITGTTQGMLPSGVLSTTLPLDVPAPELRFEGTLWVFTGQLAYGPRSLCEQEVESRGGKCNSNVTQKTNYLVVGTLASRDWAHSTHGRKIETAVDYRIQGLPIAIVGEDHWAQALEAG